MATGGESGMNTSSDEPLWDSRNPEEQEIVRLSVKYKNLLKNKLSELTECVQLQSMIPHLKQLDVIDKKLQDRLLVNATLSDSVERLVDYLESGPCWRLHGFLRALSLTRQRHILTLLGVNPAGYEDTPSSPQPPAPSPSAGSYQGKPHFYNRPESEVKLQISNDLLPGLLQHCGFYNLTLLKTSLFDYDDTVPIDVTELYIGTDPECKNNQRLCVPINKMDMFLQLFQRHPPNTISVEGPAGTGKSAFTQDYAYNWSKDITTCEVKGLDTPCPGHTWRLVLYIPLGSIRGSVEDAIRANLRCEEHLKQQIMDEIKRDGEGILVIGDGIDELRDNKTIQNLRDYTKHSQAPVGKPAPKVLITARDGLLSIPRGRFDRELHIKGFSHQQGVAYMWKYFTVMHKITSHPVLDYAETHREELGWVLQNPLQVQILTELTASGFLTLDDVKSLSTVKLFRALDFHTTTRDEKCKAGGADSSNFYKACLRCLLNNERQITEEEVGSGCPYLSLLTKSTYRDQDYKERHRYGFPHEMVFEFFSMRGVIDYIKSAPSNKKALLLYLCSNPNMQNVLRLTCGFLTQYERDMFPDTVVAIIRCCLLLRTDIEPCVKNELTEELPELPDQIQDSFPRDLVSCGLTTEQTAKMDRMFDLLQEMFTEPDDCLKKYGWASTEAKWDFFHKRSSFHRFILTCVEQCTPADRAAVLQRTTQHLLPCAIHDCQPDFARYVVPGVSGRHTTTYRGPDTTLFIYTWCPQDLAAALHTHNQLQQLQHTDERYSHLHTQIRKLNLTQQYEDILLYVNSRLWGSVPAGGWSEEEWTPALTQLLLLQYDMRYIVIDIEDQVPLGGLLSACRKVITHGHKLTRGLSIRHGKVQEEELLQFFDWAHRVGLAVQLYDQTVVLAAGRDPAQYQDVDSAIRQKAHLVRGEREENVSDLTYVSVSGQVLCERYNP